MRSPPALLLSYLDARPGANNSGHYAGSVEQFALVIRYKSAPALTLFFVCSEIQPVRQDPYLTREEAPMPIVPCRFCHIVSRRCADCWRFGPPRTVSV